MISVSGASQKRNNVRSPAKGNSFQEHCKRETAKSWAQTQLLITILGCREKSVFICLQLQNLIQLVQVYLLWCSTHEIIRGKPNKMRVQSKKLLVQTLHSCFKFLGVSTHHFSCLLPLMIEMESRLWKKRKSNIYDMNLDWGLKKQFQIRYTDMLAKSECWS